MVSVQEAERIVLEHRHDYGTCLVALDQALGRVLAEDIYADRDFPPYNRVTMDGIALQYRAFAKGLRTFRVQATQSAGDRPPEINQEEECIEIMTGAALPSSADTIIPYEEIDIQDGIATLKTDKASLYQYVHVRGKDKKEKELLAGSDQRITPDLIAVAATVGKTQLLVKRGPRVLVISTGDELVSIDKMPMPYQIRRSNDYTLQAVLKQLGIQADTVHLPDDSNMLRKNLKEFLDTYEVLLISGGVSKGKFDFIPSVLSEVGVSELFHNVRQRPGKPFWFGVGINDGTRVFAFPGNPVSTFMCVHRYFIPWLKACWQLPSMDLMAILDEDVSFLPALQYFLQVRMHVSQEGRCLAVPVFGNGSGDFANLLVADGFLELPLEKSEFKRGEVFRLWPFKPTFYP